MKPASFFNLPYDLRESLLWDIELDYDSYESSKEACIHGIMNESYDLDRNKDKIANYYKALDEESLTACAINVEKDITARSRALRSFIGLHIRP